MHIREFSCIDLITFTLAIPIERLICGADIIEKGTLLSTSKATLMTFLANENFPAPSVVHLQRAGFDVLSGSKLFHGSSDEEIIAIAKARDLVILTMDKDYGLLIFKGKIKDPPPIVFFRFPNECPPDLPGRIFEEHMEGGSVTIAGRFTVVEERKALGQRHY